MSASPTVHESFTLSRKLAWPPAVGLAAWAGTACRLLLSTGALALLFAAPAPAQTPDPLVPGLWRDPPAGEYRLDPTHASLVVRVNHLGVASYMLHFTRLEARLQFDPDNPAAMTLVAEVDPASLTTHYPRDDIDFDAFLAGPDWLDTALYPRIEFHSTRIDLHADGQSAAVMGELNFRGVTAPLMLEIRYGGGYAGLEVYDPKARIGFSATGRLDRSAFGMDGGLPPEGSLFGVGDGVELRIDAEFTGPPLAAEAG